MNIETGSPNNNTRNFQKMQRRPVAKMPSATPRLDPTPPSTPTSTWRLLQISATANSGGFLVGIHLALFSGILENSHFATSMGAMPLTPMSKSVITTALITSFTLASPFAGPLIDAIGRRPALMLSAAVFAISSSLALFATSVAHIVVTRLVAGAAYALVNIVCPMYTAEIAPPAYRGMLVNLYQLCITLGILFAQLVNWRLLHTGWTAPIMYSLIPAIIMLFSVWLLVPESPAWQPLPTDAATASIDDEETGGQTAVRNQISPIRLTELLDDPSARRRLLIGSGVSAAQQWSGINAVIFFGPALVSDVLQWHGDDASLLAAAYVGLANVLATIASVVLVGRFGRRTLLLSGGPPMMASLLVLGGMKGGMLSTRAVTGIAALVVYVVAFATTYGPLPFVVCSEIFPVRYKGVGMSFCSAILGISSMVVGVTFLPLLQEIGGGVYFMYAAFLAASTAFIWRVVPETRNLSLEQVDALLEGKPEDP